MVISWVKYWFLSYFLYWWKEKIMKKYPLWKLFKWIKPEDYEKCDNNPKHDKGTSLTIRKYKRPGPLLGNIPIITLLWHGLLERWKLADLSEISMSCTFLCYILHFLPTTVHNNSRISNNFSFPLYILHVKLSPHNLSSQVHFICLFRIYCILGNIF